MNIEKERELFEAWIREEHPGWRLDRCELDPEQYHTAAVYVAWEAWQARAAIAPTPKP